jgi:hypothetical protein
VNQTKKAQAATINAQIPMYVTVVQNFTTLSTIPCMLIAANALMIVTQAGESFQPVMPPDAPTHYCTFRWDHVGAGSVDVDRHHVIYLDNLRF